MTNFNLTSTSFLVAERHTNVHGDNAVATHRMVQNLIDQWPGYVHVIGAGSIWHDNKDNARVLRYRDNESVADGALLVVQDQSIDQYRLAALMDLNVAVVYMTAGAARSDGDIQVARRTGNRIFVHPDNSFSAADDNGVFIGTIQ